MILLSLSACTNHQSNTAAAKAHKTSTSKNIKKHTTSPMRHLTGDYWQLSSEVMNYPDLTKFTNLSIETSISKNRTYLKSN